MGRAPGAAPVKRTQSGMRVFGDELPKVRTCALNPVSLKLPKARNCARAPVIDARACPVVHARHVGRSHLLTALGLNVTEAGGHTERRSPSHLRTSSRGLCSLRFAHIHSKWAGAVDTSMRMRRKGAASYAATCARETVWRHFPSLFGCWCAGPCRPACSTCGRGPQPVCCHCCRRRGQVMNERNSLPFSLWLTA